MTKQWQLSENETYTRALGGLEYKFWLDARFNGTADHFARIILRLQPGFVISQEKLDNAWTVCRQSLPLLAARILPAKKKEDVRFAVSVADLTSDAARVIERSGEDLADRLLGPERQLDDQHQSRCYASTSRPGSLDLFFLLSHSIADGISSILLARRFCDALAQGSASKTLSNEELAAVLEKVPCQDTLIANQLGTR